MPLLAVFLFLTALSTLLLYVLSDQTDRYFAWTIQPPMSAAFLGAGYAAGFVLIALITRDRSWLNSRLGLVTVHIFVLLTLVATLLHLDRFHFDADGTVAVFAAWLWMAVYVVVPVWMLVLEVAELRDPAQAPSGGRPIPPWVVLGLGVQGGLLLATGVAMLLVPARVERIWAWELTPLTSRATGAWLIALGAAACLAIGERDLHRLRAPTATFAVFGVLQYGALVRFADQVRWGRPGTWVWLLLLASFVAMGVWGFVASRPPEESRPVTVAPQRQPPAQGT